MGKILECKNVSVKYESALAVDNVSFSIEENDYLCIVGENGSGKSSLMKAILGLVKPSDGTIEFSGFRQNEIGYIPQQTPVQKDFPASVYEVTLSGCLSHHSSPRYTKKDKELAKENLKRLGADAFIKKSFRELSGGQQQRVLLARALCATEKLLLLDEPVTGLDPVMTNELYSLLEKLHSQGLCIIMISHDVASAVKYGGKILHMNTKQQFFGTAAEYIKSNVGMRMLGGEAHD